METNNVDPLADKGGRRAGDTADSLSAILDAQQEQQSFIPGIDNPVDDTPFEMTGHPAAEVPEEDELPEETPVEPAEEVVEQQVQETPAEQEHRFANQEEAERAHREAEQRMTQEAQERAALMEQLQQLQYEMALLRQQQARPPEPEPEPEPELPAFDAVRHWEDTYSRIDNLDPDADDYERQRTTILAEANRVQAEAFENRTLQQARQYAKQEIQAALRPIQESNQERVRRRLLERAATAGLDVAEESPSNPLGGRHLQDLYAVIERGLYPQDATEDQAIDAVVDLVKKRHAIEDKPSRTPQPNGVNGNGVQPKPNPEVQAEVTRNQAINTPMERSGVGRTPTQQQREADEPVTMDGVLAAIQDHRTIRR